MPSGRRTNYRKGTKKTNKKTYRKTNNYISRYRKSKPDKSRVKDYIVNIPTAKFGVFPAHILKKLTVEVDLFLPGGSQGYNLTYFPLNYLTGVSDDIVNLNVWNIGQVFNPSTPPDFPQGFTHYMNRTTGGIENLYKKYYVHASTMTMRVKARNPQDRGTFYVVPLSSISQLFVTPTKDQVTNLRQLPGSKSADFDNETSGPRDNVIKVYQRSCNLDGRTRQEYNAEDSYSGSRLTEPVLAQRWLVGWYQDKPGALSADGIAFRFTIDYFVEFLDLASINHDVNF